MKMNPFTQRFAAVLLLVLALVPSPLPAPAENAVDINGQYELAIPGFKPGMMKSDYWIRTLKRPDEIIMSPEEIDIFNQRNVRHCEKLVDVEHYRRLLRGPEIRDLIRQVSRRPDNPRFRNGNQLRTAFFNRLQQNCNLEKIPRVVRTRFAVTVRRTEMRAFPTSIRIFSEPDDYEFDRLIETTLYPLEPIVILHTSRDGQWFFAQCRNYLAWIQTKDVAVGGREEIFSVLNRRNFLVVTGKKVFSGFNPLTADLSEVQLDMGVRVPLALKDEIPQELDGQHPLGNYVVKLPIRTRTGNLLWKLGLVSLSDDVSMGYLPYTRRNIIQQAFKFLGQRYGWGGMFNARDCSSFIMDVYRTMGLSIPRNASEQGKMSAGRFHELTADMSLDERIQVFKRIPPVTPVYMNGHAMLYLNKSGKDFFIIHDFIGLKTRVDGELKSIRTRSVFVTPLRNTYLSSGKTYLEGLYGAREYK